MLYIVVQFTFRRKFSLSVYENAKALLLTSLSTNRCREISELTEDGARLIYSCNLYPFWPSLHGMKLMVY